MPDADVGQETQLRSDYQSGNLISCTTWLAQFAAEETDELRLHRYATIALVTGAAACEALLSEVVYITAPAQFTPKFRRASVSGKYNLFKQGATNANLDSDHPEVSELLTHKNAIAHSEPNNPRSSRYVNRLSADGARWAALTVIAFAEAIWGANMPAWLNADVNSSKYMINHIVK
jgi:hypothetical protein